MTTSALSPDALRYKYALKYRLSEEDAELLLDGDDEATVEQKAQRLAQRTGTQASAPPQRPRLAGDLPSDTPADALGTALMGALNGNRQDPTAQALRQEIENSATPSNGEPPALNSLQLEQTLKAKLGATGLGSETN